MAAKLLLLLGLLVGRRSAAMTTGIGALSVKCRGGATTDFATLFGRDTAPGGAAFAHRRRTTRWMERDGASRVRAVSLTEQLVLKPPLSVSKKSGELRRGTAVWKVDSERVGQYFLGAVVSDTRGTGGKVRVEWDGHTDARPDLRLKGKPSRETLDANVAGAEGLRVQVAAKAPLERHSWDGCQVRLQPTAAARAESWDFTLKIPNYRVTPGAQGRAWRVWDIHIHRACCCSS
jgi:hypothetical protein